MNFESILNVFDEHVYGTSVFHAVPSGSSNSALQDGFDATVESG